MELEKKVFLDGKLINTINYIGESAYKELSVLFINAYNNFNSGLIYVWNVINHDGLHEIKAEQRFGNGYVYTYHFTGEDVEYLPTLTR